MKRVASGTISEEMEEYQCVDMEKLLEKDQLDKLRCGIRAGSADTILAAYVTLRKGKWLYEIQSLLKFMKEQSEIPEDSCGVNPVSHRCPFGRRARSRKEYPNLDIVESLARLGLKEHLFAYLFRFPRPYPEEMAVVSEILQMNPFNWKFRRTSNGARSMSSRQPLNFFRLAQRIRNEHGTVRQNSPPECFGSFGDIRDLERAIKAGSVVDFVVQGIRLEVVDPRHLGMMYGCTSSLAQLEALHEEITAVGGEDLRDYAAASFGMQFRTLSTGVLDSPPSWREVRKYLRMAPYFNPGDEIIFGAEILEEELDEAMNCLLNSVMRVSVEDDGFYSVFLTDKTVQILKELLDRGASLFSRNPGEEKSSLGALVEFADVIARDLPLSEFSSYICCPLVRSDLGVTFDARRLARLSCLAARRILPSTIDSEPFGKLRPFIEAHQELQSQLGVRFKAG